MSRMPDDELDRLKREVSLGKGENMGRTTEGHVDRFHEPTPTAHPLGGAHYRPTSHRIEPVGIAYLWPITG